MFKIFIINLKRSKDRKAYICAEICDFFKKYPHLKEKFEFCFFDAVDGQNNEHLAFKKHFAPLLSTMYAGGSLMSKSEMACFASHYLLWQKCVKLNENIIILEDDINFNNKNFALLLEKISRFSYEFVRLDMCESKKYKISYNINEFIGIVLKNNFFSTQAYFLSPIGGNKLIKSAKFWFCPVDYYLDSFYIHKVFNLVYLQNVITNFNAKSTIESKSHLKIYILRKIFRPFSKLFCHIYKFIFLFKNNPKRIINNLKKQI